MEEKTNSIYRHLTWLSTQLIQLYHAQLNHLYCCSANRRLDHAQSAWFLVVCIGMCQIQEWQ